jgi:ferredoxin-thioredoxin reductase catalytic subunit
MIFPATSLLYRCLTHAALALLGTLSLVASAEAGISNSVRTSAPIGYSSTQVYSEGAYDLQAYWKDQIYLLEWSSPRGVTIRNSRIYGAQDQELLVTMLDARAVCGIRACPVRIYTGGGELVMEISACDAAELHEISIDRRDFIACGLSYRIEKDNSLRDASASTTASKRFWHNGSIVEATFYADHAISIRYAEPKDSLPANMRGAVLFEGRIGRDGGLTGIAYTFKTGCPPAPYSVTGISRPTNIALTGASPVRDPYSCAITGRTYRSPNARLSFIDLTMATR